VTAILTAFLIVAMRAAATMPMPQVERTVHGRVLVSTDLPAAVLRFSRPFRYVGSQVVRLYGNADAEQHLFVVAGRSGSVQKFYWIQFEHFLPTNQMSYDYAPTRTTEIGKLRFIYDVRSFSDYGSMHVDPVSDSAAIRRMLAAHGLRFPERVARARMFFLPAADRRSELMMIYGEALPANTDIPTAEDGVPLDDAAPAAALSVLEHARAGLRIE
jgi:hypothetical protein